MHGALKLSNKWSLVAIQHSVVAWVRLRNDVEGSGVLSCDDGARKFRKLDSLLQEEVLCTCYAFLGKDDVADFGMVDQLIREQCESKKDMPLLSSHLQKVNCAAEQKILCSAPRGQQQLWPNAIIALGPYSSGGLWLYDPQS